MAPRYPLERVVRAALLGDVELVGSRARVLVAQYVDSFLRAHELARAILAGLSLVDFEECVHLDEPPYRGWFDVYLPRLSEEVQETFGMKHAPQWYVKLKLVEAGEHGLVVCVSLHPAERGSRRSRRLT